MRVVIQRVISGSVSVGGELVSSIGTGFVILVGVKEGDTEAELDYLVKKVAGLRVFEDEQDKMNLSILEVRGEILLVSQFTLYADTRKGRRPSFVQAARPETAEPLIELFAQKLQNRGLPVKMGVFGAHMQVKIENDGPVTIMIEKDPEI